ncbi:MAG TPA: N-acetyltransferase [bacterium (Candidatus Stahlbacteria)]|nr:N-acetyltransferase [Candidatus Stahlbacteria bacterium]
MSIKVGKSVSIYPGVEIGNGSIIHDFAVIGFPPRGKSPGELKTKIGAGAIIRPFTTIYAGNIIGKNLQTGQGTSIRENNVIGDNVSIGTNTVLEFDNRIGSGTRIHSLCFLEMTEVGEYVFIGPRTVFTDDPHPMNCPRYRECLGGVKIGKLAKIGAGCIFFPGVRVGDNAFVCAGSVVTKDVPKDKVVAGFPARVIKSVKDLECYTHFFEHPYMREPYISSGK